MSISIRFCLLLALGLASAALSPVAARVGGAHAPAPRPVQQPPAEPVKPDKNTEARHAMMALGAAVRTYHLRFDTLPATLQELTQSAVLPAIDPDPWGKPYQYRVIDGEASSKGQPKQSAEKTYEILSAGPDREFGTEDDIRKTEGRFSLKLNREDRARIISEGGENYALSLRAWAWEQTFRLWLELAKKELEEKRRLESLSGLSLPESVFPDGKPKDVFGRRFELKNVRGVRALTAPAENDAPALWVSESDFVHVLEARIKRGNNLGRYGQNTFSEVSTFHKRMGRLPLTLEELKGTSRSRRFPTDDFENDFCYLTLNDDKSFLFISLGADRAPGGRFQNTDYPVYGVSDVSALGEDVIENVSQWYLAPSSQFVAIMKLIETRRAERPKPADGPAQPLKPKSEGDGEDPLDEPDPVEPEPMLPDDDDDDPMPSDNDEEDDEENCEPNAGQQALSLIQAASPAPNKADEAGDAPKNPDAPPPVLKSSLDLIPVKLYTEGEAEELGMIPRNNSLYILRQRLDQLFGAVWNYSSQVGPDDPLPCGNVELANARRLREVTRSPWKERIRSEGEINVMLLVTRFERDQFGNVKSLVCVAVPEENKELPIAVMAFHKGKRGGPYFAALKDQPEHWLKAAAAFDGEVASAKPRTGDKPSSNAKPSPDDKPPTDSSAAPPPKDSAPPPPEEPEEE